MRANSRWGAADRDILVAFFGLIAVPLLAACSTNLVSKLDASGTGGPAGSAGTGPSGSLDASGTGGGAGSAAAPCAAGVPPFGICFVNDADVLPLPQLEVNDRGTRTNGPTPATIVAVGMGTAPAQCESARFFGGRGASDWWFQAQTADRLWTIGVRGLGNAPQVHTNDSVTLDLAWMGTTFGTGYGPPSGHLQLSDVAATPLLWSAALAGGASYDANWVSLEPGAAICRATTLCGGTGFDTVFTVNGSMATLQPFGAMNIGGYRVASGAAIGGPGTCADYYGEPFAAAAAKLP